MNSCYPCPFVVLVGNSRTSGDHNSVFFLKGTEDVFNLLNAVVKLNRNNIVTKGKIRRISFVFVFPTDVSPHNEKALNNEYINQFTLSV